MWKPLNRCSAVWLLLFAAIAIGQEPPDRRDHLNPAGVDGTLMLAGAGELPEAISQRFVDLAGGAQARIVVLTALRDQAGAEAAAKPLAALKSHAVASLAHVHTTDHRTADDARFAEPLRNATGVWVSDNPPGRLIETFAGTLVARELAAVMKRGGVVAGSGGGSLALAEWWAAPTGSANSLSRGLGLLPGVALASGPQSQLGLQLEKHPGAVGAEIAQRTALVIHGREMRVLGEGSVAIQLAKTADRAARTTALKDGGRSDFVMWRRAALARAEPALPPKPAAAPEVPHGSLVIVGGGGMPAAIVKKFIDLAGGPDALIVVLPTAMEPGFVDRGGDDAMFRRAGANNVEILRAKELSEVEDPKTLAVLAKAKGVWFGGGRQWRFVDAYAGTKAEALFRAVLRRGGVIGGSSAGATIQGDYLCRGSPLGNLEMMCEGYERGLGFLPGVAIDQHFSQRNRFKDMTALMKSYPQLLGIGIDEATALIVHGQVAEVMGQNKVQFYSAAGPVEPGKPDYDTVYPGGEYDLKVRKILKAGDKKP